MINKENLIRSLFEDHKECLLYSSSIKYCDDIIVQYTNSYQAVMWLYTLMHQVYLVSLPAENAIDPEYTVNALYSDSAYDYILSRLNLEEFSINHFP